MVRVLFINKQINEQTNISSFINNFTVWYRIPNFRFYDNKIRFRVNFKEIDRDRNPQIFTIYNKIHLEQHRSARVRRQW